MAPAGTPPAKKGLLNSRLFGVPTPIVIIVLGAGGWYIYSKHKASSAAAATSAAAAAPTAADATSPTPAAYSGAGGGPVPNILATQPTAAATPTYSAPTGETQAGSGYYVPNSEAAISDNAGNLYEWISSFAQAQPQISAGQMLYYQPTPGIFQPATANNALIPGLSSATPLFNMVPQSQAA